MDLSVFFAAWKCGKISPSDLPKALPLVLVLLLLLLLLLSTLPFPRISEERVYTIGFQYSLQSVVYRGSHEQCR